MKPAALALGCALALALTGCGGHDKKPAANPTAPPSNAPATGMVQGRLVTVGGPDAGDPRPIPGTVTFQTPGSVTKANVDQTGRFAIGLYPGTYTIRGTSPNLDHGKLQCNTAKPKTTLTAGKTVTVDVICSIR